MKSFSLWYGMFCFTLFIKDVLQNIWRTTYLLTVHPKLNFRGALRKSLMAPEDRSYQTQCFAKIFPIQVFPLRILCYFSKTWLKIWRKSWWSSLFLWNGLILQIFFFSAYCIIVVGKTPQPCMTGEKLCLWSPTFIFFTETLRIIYICYKFLLELFLSAISSQNPKI